MGETKYTFLFKESLLHFLFLNSLRRPFRERRWNVKMKNNSRERENTEKGKKRCFSFSICSVFLSNLSSSLHLFIPVVKWIHYRWSFQCGPMETLWPVFSVDVSFLKSDWTGQIRSCNCRPHTPSLSVSHICVNHAAFRVCGTQQNVSDYVCSFFCRFWLSGAEPARQTTNTTKHCFLVNIRDTFFVINSFPTVDLLNSFSLFPQHLHEQINYTDWEAKWKNIPQTVNAAPGLLLFRTASKQAI